MNRTRRKTWLVCGLWAAVHGLLTIAPCFSALKSVPSEVCCKNACFEVETANTENQRRVGLMYREKLGINEGMLFFFNAEDNYTFWMKNMKIPLDIIWINARYQIVFTAKNCKPCTEKECRAITPNKNAKYVLELNAGQIDVKDMKIGDKFIFKLR